MSFSSRKAVARHFGMSEDVIRQREKKGRLADIVLHPERKFRDEVVSCCNHTFHSKTSFAEFLGVQPSTLTWHLKRENGNAGAVCKKFGKCTD
jgi:hypothetical protein